MKLRHIATLLLIVFGGFFLMAFLNSCRTPKQKYDYLVSKYPDLVDTDTVIVRDTIVRTIKIPIPEYRDSFIITHDTIIETKKILFKKKGDKFSLTVKPDSIIVRDTIPYKVQVPGRVVIKKEFYPWWLLVAFLVGMLFAYRLRK